MKSLVVLGVFAFASVALASPLARVRDGISPLNELPEEEKVKIDDPKHRWTLIPDGDGKMHLIDLNPYKFEEVESFFNAANDVFFMLYTRRNPTAGQRLTRDANAIRNTQFNSGAPTRFVIHGWNNDHKSAVNTQITAAYIQRGEFNVVVVDWGAGANTIDYAAARNRINDVSTVVAGFIDFLIANGFTSQSRLLIAGHSLGGHTAGLTGKKISGNKVQTIIGLDPAGPLFNTNRPDERIADSDANYVEIIHTNAWTLGFGEPLGHADFYPNYGRSQPGCGVDLTGSCAHGRAPTFFAESINSDRFVANLCASFNEVNNGRCTVQSGGHRMGGEPASGRRMGHFHLTTNSNAPFAKG